MKFSLLNENDETTSGNINGHIIMGSPVVEEGQLYNETGFDLSINLVNNEQQTVSDSLLFYDILYEIPSGVNTEQEVISYCQNSTITVIRENNLGGDDLEYYRLPGTMISHISGSPFYLIMGIVYLIVLVSLALWVCFYWKKSDKQKGKQTKGKPVPVENSNDNKK